MHNVEHATKSMMRSTEACLLNCSHGTSGGLIYPLPYTDLLTRNMCLSVARKNGYARLSACYCYRFKEILCTADASRREVLQVTAHFSPHKYANDWIVYSS